MWKCCCWPCSKGNSCKCSWFSSMTHVPPFVHWWRICHLPHRRSTRNNWIKMLWKITHQAMMGILLHLPQSSLCCLLARPCRKGRSTKDFAEDVVGTPPPLNLHLIWRFAGELVTFTLLHFKDKYSTLFYSLTFWPHFFFKSIVAHCCYSQYHFTTTCHSFSLHLHHNKSVLCASSVAPSVGEWRALNPHWTNENITDISVTITILWTKSGNEVST